MPYDADRHHRRSIRLKGYDYSQAGAYFVTIVTDARELLFDVPLLHSIAGTMWQRIPRHFAGAELDEWVVMPDHIHGIIVIAGAEVTSSVQITRHRQLSPWFEDVFGRHIEKIAATLPPEVAEAAWERGRARDLDATVKELLVELEP